MVNSKSNLILIFFLIGLLFFASTVRSDVIVDETLLPRFFSLSFLLLIGYLLLFRRKKIFRQDFWTFSFVAFYLWNLLSCFWSNSVSEAIMQSQTVFLGLAVFAMVSVYLKENSKFEIQFLRIHILVLLFTFLLAFYKMSLLQFYDPYKISSISLNNNLYSGYLLLSFPIVLTAYKMNNGVWKYLAVISAVLTLFFLVIVQTRAAYLGMFFSLIIVSCVVLIRYRNVFSKKNIITAIISLGLLISFLFIFYNSLDAIRKNAFRSKAAVWNYFVHPGAKRETVTDVALKDLKSGTSDIPSISIPVEYFENVDSRLIFWKKSAGLIKSHPLVGVGAGNWRIMIASVALPANPELTIRNYTYSQPHNEWIGIISELGIVGLLLAILVFIVPLVLILYKITFGIEKPVISVLIYTGFLLGFYVYASFDFPFKRIEHTVLLFSVFAFILNRMPLGKKEIFPEISVLNTKSVQTIFVSLLIFTAIVGAFRLKGEYNTLKIFTYERRNDKAVIQYAQKAGNAFYSITPNTLPVAWFEGVAYYRMGFNQRALKCFKLALRSTPYEVRVINDYGAALYSIGEQEKAISVLTNCTRIDAAFDEAKYNLSAIYYSMHKPDSALYYASQCRDSQKKKDYLEEIKKSGIH